MINKNEDPNITIGEAQPLLETLSDDLCSEETANDARAKSGWLALQAYTVKAYGNPSPPVEQGIQDLLGALQHTCNHLGLDFSELLERATGTYTEELQNPLG